MAPGAAVIELPGIPLTLFAGPVNYVPGHFVYLQIAALKHFLPLCFIHRVELGCHCMHPVVDGGCGQLHSHVGILFHLTVFGQVVTVFVNDDVCKHIRSHMIATDDRLCGFRLVDARIGEFLVRFLAIYGAYCHIDPHSGVLVMECPCHIPADYDAVAQVNAFRIDCPLALLQAAVLIAGRARGCLACRLTALLCILFYCLCSILYLCSLLLHCFFEETVEKAGLDIRDIRL